MKLELFEADELIALAAINLEKEELGPALEILNYLKQQKLESDELDSMLGSIYAKLQLFDKAARHYRALLDRSPDRLHEKFQLGMVYREMNDTVSALSYWEQVLELSPDYPPVLFHKGTLLLINNDVESAKQLLIHLIDVADKDNYYVERALEVLDEIANTAELVPEIDSVH
ncbi:tetratricopeptide repeat protein [Motilimonas cestriensis]|uniref:Tetratricopeptide repeat protein n=1 Tax=Motilimonas cestriensis TaxID=2742685 RepID=A0ABS8WEW2_9GAMM|nr:tetratricopeptide repeat protein [Motilimonas cestriensis]MCE2597103.1 tetratricopeptide repeat protein [Motilimonas cestriensis]